MTAGAFRTAVPGTIAATRKIDAYGCAVVASSSDTSATVHRSRIAVGVSGGVTEIAARARTAGTGVTGG